MKDKKLKYKIGKIMTNIYIENRIDEIKKSLEKFYGTFVFFKQLNIIDVKVVDENNFFITTEIESNFFNSSYKIYMFHSENEFKTRKNVSNLTMLTAKAPKDNTFDDLIGGIEYYINKYNNTAYLQGIQVGEEYCGMGYGSQLMQYFKQVLKSVEKTGGVKLSYINGKFVPCGSRSVSKIRDFYLRHGADSKWLDRVGKIKIKIDDFESYK